MSMSIAMAMIAVMASSIHGARILALFPSHSRSHVISFEALTLELAARGHELVVVSSFPQEKPVANYTDIAVPAYDAMMDKVDLFDFKLYDMIESIFTMGGKLCDHYLQQPGVLQLIHDKDQHFDLILFGMIYTECYLGFAHKYKAPVIGLSPLGGTSYNLAVVGNPNAYAHIPTIFLPYSQHMTFKQRLLNTVATLGGDLLRDYVVIPSQDKAMRKYFSEYEPIPYVTDLERNISLILINAHVSISRNPRPYLPNVIEVGGMHIRPAKKLPQDIQTFMDEAKDGVIYFSMGSNIKTSKMAPEKRDAFIAAFSKLKQRVLWKSDVETLPGLPPNVKLGKWMPQIPILAHPRTKLFISHGGLLSTQEAIYHSVPVIGIPIFADQALNMQRANDAGYAIPLEYNNITLESLQWALDLILNQPSYRTSVKQLSELFRDQPHTPLEQAVFWTEYVLRHDGARHMRCASLDLAWYQYFLLDVIGLIALGTLVVSLTIVWAIRALVRLICLQKDSNMKNIASIAKKVK